MQPGGQPGSISRARVVGARRSQQAPPVQPGAHAAAGGLHTSQSQAQWWLLPPAHAAQPHA